MIVENAVQADELSKSEEPNYDSGESDLDGFKTPTPELPSSPPSRSKQSPEFAVVMGRCIG